MALDMVVSALSMAKQIYDMAQTALENVERTKELGQRAATLEQPLRTLQTKCKYPKIYESAIRKLIPVLEECQEMVLKQSKKGVKSGVKKFLLGSDIQGEFAGLNAKLDSCLLDLQLTISASEAAASDEKIADGAKATAFEIADAAARREREPLLKCIQCGEDYRESTNGDGQCKFHALIWNNQGSTWYYPCCNETEGWISGRRSKPSDVPPCKRSSHRQFHHHEYSYENYYIWTYEQSRIITKWLDISLPDYEEKWYKQISFGIKEDEHIGIFFVHGPRTIFGQIFPIFTLQEYDGSNSPSNLVLIRDISKAKEGKIWWMRAYWVLNPSTHRIEGIQVSVKVQSSDYPIVKKLSFSLNPPTVGVITDLTVYPEESFDDDGVAFPDEPYSIGYSVPESIFEAARLPPEDTNPGELPVFMRQASPCGANVGRNAYAADIFVNELYIQNISGSGTGPNQTTQHLEEKQLVMRLFHEQKITMDEAIKLYDVLAQKGTSSYEPVTIIGVRTEVYENEKWVPIDETVIEKETLPIVIKPADVKLVKVLSYWPCPEKKASHTGTGRSFVARLGPVKMKIIFETIDRKTAEAILHYANPPSSCESYITKAPEDLFFLYCDDEVGFDRLLIRVTELKDGSICIMTKGSGSREFTLTEQTIENIMYESTKESEKSRVVSISDHFVAFELKWFDMEKTSFALLDTKRKYIYGFRFCLKVKERESRGSWIVDTRKLFGKSPVKEEKAEEATPVKQEEEKKPEQTVQVTPPKVTQTVSPVATSSVSAPPAANSAPATKLDPKTAFYCKTCSLNPSITTKCIRCPGLKSANVAVYCNTCTPMRGQSYTCVKCTKPAGPGLVNGLHPPEQAAHLCNGCSFGPKKCIKCQKIVF